jgi:hypothetical protein
LFSLQAIEFQVLAWKLPAALELHLGAVDIDHADKDSSSDLISSHSTKCIKYKMKMKSE